MKQQVNLYLPEFRIKRDKLTFLLMAQILGAVAGLVLLLTLTDLWRSYRVGRELSMLQEQLTVETQRTAEVDAILARQSQDPELTQRLAAAEEMLDRSRQIRDFFNSRQGGNATGFSEYFKDLSRAAVDGLWITEFSIAGEGTSVNLKGFTIESSLVPVFVDRLGNGRSPLANQHFSFSTVLNAGENQLYAFELTTNR